MWLTDNEGARFWMGIVTELKNRGVEDILIASIDGLKGFSEAIHAVFPQTTVQRCIIHRPSEATTPQRSEDKYAIRLSMWDPNIKRSLW